MSDQNITNDREKRYRKNRRKLSLACPTEATSFSDCPDPPIATATDIEVEVISDNHSWARRSINIIVSFVMESIDLLSTLFFAWIVILFFVSLEMILPTQFIHSLHSLHKSAAQSLTLHIDGSNNSYNLALFNDIDSLFANVLDHQQWLHRQLMAYSSVFEQIVVICDISTKIYLKYWKYIIIYTVLFHLALFVTWYAVGSYKSVQIQNLGSFHLHIDSNTPTIDSEPPPLSPLGRNINGSPDDLKTVSQEGINGAWTIDNWHVFDPVFGVIPRELQARWAKQSKERDAQRAIAIKKKSSKDPPPVRFLKKAQEK